MFPLVSLTEATVAVESFHPTTTILRLPEVCASGKGTVTVVCGVWGFDEFCCTNEMEA